MNEYKFVFPKQNNTTLTVNALNFADACFFVREICDIIEAHFNALDCTVVVNDVVVDENYGKEQDDEFDKA